MSNLEKYNNAFIEAFEIDEAKLAGLTYQGIPDVLDSLCPFLTAEQGVL